MPFRDWSSDCGSSDLLSVWSHSSPEPPFGPASVAASAVVVVTVTAISPSKPAGGVTWKLSTRDCTSARLAPAVTNVQVPAGLSLGAPIESGRVQPRRSEEHTSELQSLMRISYAVLRLKKKKKH